MKGRKGIFCIFFLQIWRQFKPDTRHFNSEIEIEGDSDSNYGIIIGIEIRLSKSSYICVLQQYSENKYPEIIRKRNQITVGIGRGRA